VDLIKQLLQNFGKSRCQPCCGLPKGTRQQMGYLVRRDTASVLASFGSAHAIADSKREIHAVRRRFAELAQVLDFPGVKADA
jgi:hypothetical protein